MHYKLSISRTRPLRYYCAAAIPSLQGDSADAFYIVEDGTAKITKEDPVRLFDYLDSKAPLHCTFPLVIRRSVVV